MAALRSAQKLGNCTRCDRRDAVLDVHAAAGRSLRRHVHACSVRRCRRLTRQEPCARGPGSGAGPDQYRRLLRVAAQPDAVEEHAALHDQEPDHPESRSNRVVRLARHAGPALRRAPGRACRATQPGLLAVARCPRRAHLHPVRGHPSELHAARPAPVSRRRAGLPAPPQPGPLSGVPAEPDAGDLQPGRQLRPASRRRPDRRPGGPVRTGPDRQPAPARDRGRRSRVGRMAEAGTGPPLPRSGPRGGLRDPSGLHRLAVRRRGHLRARPSLDGHRRLGAHRLVARPRGRCRPLRLTPSRARALVLTPLRRVAAPARPSSRRSARRAASTRARFPPGRPAHAVRSPVRPRRGARRGPVTPSRRALPVLAPGQASLPRARPSRPATRAPAAPAGARRLRARAARDRRGRAPGAMRRPRGDRPPGQPPARHDRALRRREPRQLPALRLPPRPAAAAQQPRPPRSRHCSAAPRRRRTRRRRRSPPRGRASRRPRRPPAVDVPRGRQAPLPGLRERAARRGRGRPSGDHAASTARGTSCSTPKKPPTHGGAHPIRRPRPCPLVFCPAGSPKQGGVRGLRGLLGGAIRRRRRLGSWLVREGRSVQGRCAEPVRRRSGSALGDRVRLWRRQPAQPGPLSALSRPRRQPSCNRAVSRALQRRGHQRVPRARRVRRRDGRSGSVARRALPPRRGRGLRRPHANLVRSRRSLRDRLLDERRRSNSAQPCARPAQEVHGLGGRARDRLDAARDRAQPASSQARRPPARRFLRVRQDVMTAECADRGCGSRSDGAPARSSAE